MNEPELFILTVMSEDEEFETDMELPSEMPVSELCKQILAILKGVDSDKFGDIQKCSLEYNNRVLNDDDTLLKVGAFDGSRLILLEE